MQFLNQHSFVLVAFASVLVFAIVVLRRGSRTSELVALASLVLGFLAAYWLMQPGPSTAPNAPAVMNRVGTGQPVLLEFQSPY